MSPRCWDICWVKYLITQTEVTTNFLFSFALFLPLLPSLICATPVLLVLTDPIHKRLLFHEDMWEWDGLEMQYGWPRVRGTKAEHKKNDLHIYLSRWTHCLPCKFPHFFSFDDGGKENSNSKTQQTCCFTYLCILKETSRNCIQNCIVKRLHIRASWWTPLMSFFSKVFTIIDLDSWGGKKLQYARNDSGCPGQLVSDPHRTLTNVEVREFFLTWKAL